MTQEKVAVESQPVSRNTVFLGLAMNATYKKRLENLLPPDLDAQIDSATLESLADPRILMLKNALTGLQNAFNRIEDQKPMLFDQTVQAVRTALQSGLKVLFLIGAVALFVALLFILTIAEVSMDAEVQDKNPGP
jgi:hypothetical protein